MSSGFPRLDVIPKPDRHPCYQLPAVWKKHISDSNRSKSCLLLQSSYIQKAESGELKSKWTMVRTPLPHYSLTHFPLEESTTLICRRDRLGASVLPSPSPCVLSARCLSCALPTIAELILIPSPPINAPLQLLESQKN